MTTNPPVARLSCIALDCPDARSLAEFYAAITGWPISPEADDDWVQLDSGGAVDLAFQQVEDYQPPRWPGQERPQQAHLDLVVDDLDEGERRVLALGATKHAVQPGTGFRVFLDPAGHPFCLVR